MRTTQEGHITDRFNKAIEHLGSDQLAKRLGGIYALERIARDSERDHWPIMEILTADVRAKAKFPSMPEEEWNLLEEDEVPPVLPDIQAILTVLGRRVQSYEREGQTF